MLTTKYRPRTFREIVGQDVNVELLRSVVKNPEGSPKVFIFQGDFGTGKTTSARVLARALNCLEDTEPCGSCENCAQDPSFSSFCQEFDASDVGTKESIETLREDFFSPVSGVDWRVIILDEFHLASRQAQSALLKTLEDLPPRLFTILCTTNVDKIISTLRSRSVELVFQKAPHAEVKKNLDRISKLEGIEIRPALLDLICHRSRGHIRDSVMLLDVYQSLEDKRTILSHLRSSEETLINLLVGVRRGDTPAVTVEIKNSLEVPLDTLKGDLYLVLQEALKFQATGYTDSPYEDAYKVLTDVWGADLIKLLSFSMSDWAVNSFKDDRAVQAFFWSLFLTFGKSRGGGETKGARFKKRG